MRRKVFVDREGELKLLEELWEKKDFSLVIVYGRRRVGKTRLLTEFARGKKHVYYVAVESPFEILCREFSESVKTFLKLPFSGDIIDVISSIADVIKEKVLIVIDEFQYVVSADPAFTSRLQRVIDLKLKDKKLMLVLCGSAVSFFERKLLGYKSPIFGRREAALKLKPLKFTQIKGFFPRYSVEDLIIVYGVVGGTPAYLEKLDPAKNVKENVRTVITPGSYLYDEALNILRQEVREPRTYFTILATIAEGKDSPGEIASKAHVDPRTISKYVNLLEELDILERRKPLGYSKPVKLRFKDNYFRFWFTYIYKLRSLLESGFIEEAYTHISDSLNQYLAKIFEDLVMELVPSLYRVGLVKSKPVQMGSWWHKNLEIDTVVRDPGKSTTFIEVKWREINVLEVKKILGKLEAKAAKTGLTSPNNYYILVARKIVDVETPLKIDEYRVALDLKTINSILETDNCF